MISRSAQPRRQPTQQPAGGRAERRAVSAVFGLSGFIFGSWVSRIPAAADAIHASPAVLGSVLLAIAAGAAVSMPIVGRLCARWSSTPVTRGLAFAVPLTLPPAALAHRPATLALALALQGIANGGLDVAMNANAVAAVRRARRALMPGFHGMYSVGGMAGAVLGGVLTSAGLGMARHFLIATAVGLAVALTAGRWLPPDPVSTQPLGAVGSTSARRRRPRLFDALLVVLGLIAFCSALGEGAMADWSALFLRDVLGSGEGTATAGYAAFSVAMAASRFAGGAVISRFDPARVLAAGCTLATAGTVLAVLAPVPAVAVIAFAAVGVGLSCGFPVALNAAGAHRIGSGPAIGLVSTVGYAGFLAGPPLIGLVADQTSLRWGLCVVAVAAAVGALLALRWRDELRRHDPSQQPLAA